MKAIKHITILTSILSVIISCGASMPLKEYKDASTLRDKTIKYELQNYSKEQFDIAESSFAEATILIDENKEPDTVKELLTTASNAYLVVLNEGLPVYAEELKTETSRNRVYSKDIKAYIVDKENYELAELNYINALSALSTNNYELAVDSFLKTRDYHSKAFFNTKELFDNSLKGIQEADDKIKQIEVLENPTNN
ncbi:hypothetical protein [Brachyspira pilosicoli]|uniref:hypothetical protein n=1 Tax=Brachyspira pilosicoli TaxID=52584 RepID=UPI001CA5E32E|nr:hypothetical protein [Brachyspira pilosicoli]MBW5397618.1 hypothetical protein [Brachyspira pilosicoli]